MSLECEFCKKTFSTISSLNLHKKTTKRCLKIQAELIDIQLISKFSCKYCNKNFSLKHHYDLHIDTCKEKDIVKYEDIKNKYEELLKKHEELKIELAECKVKLECKDEEIKRLEILAKKSTTTNNYNNCNNKIETIINQLPAMTNENIKGSFLEHINTNSMSKGTTRFIMDFTNMAKKYSRIADMSRNKLIAKDEKGEKVDLQFESFVQRLFKICEEQGLQLTEEALKELKEKESDTIFDNLNIKRTNEIYDIQHAFRESAQDRDHKILNEVVSRLKKQGKLISK